MSVTKKGVVSCYRQNSSLLANIYFMFQSGHQINNGMYTSESLGQRQGAMVEQIHLTCGFN